MQTTSLLQPFGFCTPEDLALFARFVCCSPAAVRWQLAEFVEVKMKIAYRPVARPQLIRQDSTTYSCLRDDDYVLFAWKTLYQWTSQIRQSMKEAAEDCGLFMMPVCYSCALSTGGWCGICDTRDGVLTDMNEMDGDLWSWRPFCSFCEDVALRCSYCNYAGAELR